MVKIQEEVKVKILRVLENLIFGWELVVAESSLVVPYVLYFTINMNI